MVKVLKLFQLLITNRDGLAKGLLDNHLTRRRYIVSRAATHFGKDKHEPAPLLGLNLLDIGCGSSTLAEELTFRGANVTGIDIDEGAIQAAGEHAQRSGAMVNFIHGPAEDILKEGKKFDIILCMDLFETVPNINKFMWLIKQIMQPNGILIFSGNNRNLRSLIVNILISKYILKLPSFTDYQLRFFKTPQKLDSKLNIHGMKIDETLPIYFDTNELRWRRGKNHKVISAKFVGTASFNQ